MINQTPWFQRKFSFDFQVGFLPVIQERLRGTVPRIKEIIADHSEEDMEFKPEGQWSIKEHIGHLNDLESLWFGRIDDFLNGATSLRKADLTNSKTHSANHNMKDSSELVNLFAKSRSLLLDRIEQIDEVSAGLTSLHPRLQEPMRLIDSIFFVAEHDDHHLAKMRRLIEGKA